MRSSLLLSNDATWHGTLTLSRQFNRGKESMRKLRVLIADDHEGIRLTIVQALSNDFKIVGVAGDGEELVDSAVSLNPDVIVTDISYAVFCLKKKNKELSDREY